MENLDKEIFFVQNPALGAAALWRFVIGYYSTANNPVPFPLLFVVLPITFRKELTDIINSTLTKSGLPKFSEKLFAQKSNNSLYTVSDMAINMRRLTLNAFTIGSATNLFYIDKASALVYPLYQSKTPKLKENAADVLKAAERLGIWCSQYSLNELCKWLKVRF